MMTALARYTGSMKSIYAAKRMTADEAVGTINPAAGFITLGCYAGAPSALSAALARAATAGFFTATPALYLFRAPPDITRSLMDIHVLGEFRLMMPFIAPEVRPIIQNAAGKPGVIKPGFVPGHFSELDTAFMERMGAPDAHLFQVSPMDTQGYFSFGVDGSYSIPMSRLARTVIVEVNPQIPRTFGSGIIHISDIDAIVEHESDVLLLPPRVIGAEDEKIASCISDIVPENACLQLGIGGVPNAVGAFLKSKNDLGIHTELLCDSLVELIINGNVTNKYKNLNRNYTVYNVVMLGDRDYYRFMDNNPTMQCHPASYVNDPQVIAQHDNMLSVNSFIEIDLFGQVASESVHWHQMTGSGGQVDFVRGAARSRGGKSILAAHATAKSGTLSKVVPRLNNIVTTLRTDVHYVATEYGMTNLFGMTTAERAAALIALAHPDFRPWLKAEARTMGLL